MTAVEWLIEQIKNDQNQKALSAKEWIKVIEQAKEMEKQQMRTAYTRGYNDKEKGFFNAAKLITKNRKQ